MLQWKTKFILDHLTRKLSFDISTYINNIKY